MSVIKIFKLINDINQKQDLINSQFKMKLKPFTTLLLLVISLVSFSQDIESAELYLDENLKEINTSSYSKKCKQITKKCLEYKTDSLTINKVLNKFYFNKLNSTEYEQIRLLINKDSKTLISSGEIIIIKYYDSLLSYETLYNRHVKHTQIILNDTSFSMSEKRRKIHDYDKSKFKKNKSKWLKKQNKCVEKYEKKLPIKINYLYKAEENVVNNYDGFNWIKDNGIFKNNFFKIIYNYNLVIIKPDGEYFLKGGHLTDKLIEKLIKNHDWSKFKNDLKQSEEKNIINGYGLFKKILPNHHSKHCF